jgi:hypothetical protein
MVLLRDEHVLETIVGGYMWDVLSGVLFFCLGAFLVVMVFNEQMEEILGTTYSELSSMKGECELTLPRNKECVASIVFLPTAIEE